LSTRIAEEFDVIVCGAGSGGGFFAGEVAPYASVLILDAGPHIGGDALFGVGSAERRRFSTQINLGTYFPDTPGKPAGDAFFGYKMYMSQANPVQETIQREAKVVGGGSFINVGAWIRPRLVDWDGFAEETGVEGWTKSGFERHFRKAEQILHVHRNRRDVWNKASILYEQSALRLGIPIFETASNRHNCIFCGHRFNAGVPCKYDALMSTAITQIPKAIRNGAKLLDNATVVRVEISSGRATGVTFIRGGETFTATAKKLVVVSSGAIGTPALLRTSGLFDRNRNVGQYLRAHPGAPIDALMPTDDWDTDRGYQWNCHHYLMNENGEPEDALIHIAAGFPANTPWAAAAVGTFGQPYKDLMRKFRYRAGAYVFQLKPAMYGQVAGDALRPLIFYPVVDKTGKIEPKTLNDLVNSVRQVAAVYKSLGAITTYPNGDDPRFILDSLLTQFVTVTGALHPQGTCRAAANAKRGVVDTNGMSFDIANLMCCDASVIPHHISSNPNSIIMALASRASEIAVTEVLGKTIRPEDRAESFMGYGAQPEVLKQ
jgi:choline dehydrogenase-like flavoprotein